MQVQQINTGKSAAVSSETGLKRMAKLKTVVSGIDWLLLNDALTNSETVESLKQAQRLLKQEIIMVDYGL